MRETLRWYGPGDPVTLDNVKQAGATEVVSALHHLYDGRAWTDADIADQKARVEAAGLIWSVVESIPVNNDIKIAGPGRARYIGWYKDSIRALGRQGITTLCYNFMPVVDWTRTDLTYRMPSTGYALRYDAVDFAAYDLFVLRRPGVTQDYSNAQIAAAESRFKEIPEDRMAAIERTLIAGLPATERKFDRASFLAALREYDGVTADDLRANLAYFLREIVPVAEESGIRLCIHPDDPPFSLYGLPRVVSTASDIRAIFAAADTPTNGLTFCTGSFGVREDNDLVAMVREFGPRIHFVHLRNVTREPDGSFHEADHLGGSTNMPAVVIALMQEQARRKAEGRADWQLPMRPDHGHLLADDIGKARINPGYSLIGRLKGLAELRGVMQGVSTLYAMQAGPAE
ncbi:MAG: mannonate dehydratase [Pseudorhodobacter sp.]|nr:mannonate dehydratase [Pseudorhodobacter sp.]